MSLPASFHLAVALRRVPAAFRVEKPGVLVLIRFACGFRWADPIYGGKRELVTLAMRAAMEGAEGRGKGHAAKRHAARNEAERQSAQDTLADRMAQDDDTFPAPMTTPPGVCFADKTSA